MPTHTDRGFSTRSLHTQIPYLQPLPHVMPPFRTSTYVTESLDQPADLEFPFKYARLGHPNSVLLEYTLSSLAQGEDAIVVADGMRAISLACMFLINFNRPKGTIISTQPLYSDTYGLFTENFAQWGRRCIALNADKFLEHQLTTYLMSAQRNDIPKVDFIFIESPANPTLTVFDIKKISDIARPHYIPVVVDNTFASPYNQRPLLLGADLVIESLTKYCGGHGVALGGAVIGKRGLIEPIRNKMRREGGHLDPDSTWLIQMGLQTLTLRMQAHNRNAALIATFLNSPPYENKISAIYYPGLPFHPGHSIAKAQMRTPYGKPGYSGMVSFELSRPEWVKPFAEYLAKETFIELAVSLGSISSTFSVPARQIHGALSQPQRDGMGIHETLIRFSVGTENIKDIKYALNSALNHLS